MEARLPHLISQDGRVRELSARTSVGRAPGSVLFLPDPRVSSSHASLIMDASGWRLTDLDSRNGTWVNGRRVTGFSPRNLERGATLQFGGEDAPRWTFDPNPEWRIFANRLGSDEQRAGQGNLLTLPDDDGPWSVMSVDARWVLEREGVETPVVDGQIIDAPDRWQLVLSPAGSTVGPAQSWSVRRARFSFSADPTERFVSLRVEQDGMALDLGESQRWRVLLFLAQEYVYDHGKQERGWVENERAAALTDKGGTALSVTVTRIRQALCKAGFPDGSDIIRARPGSLRLGVDPAGWSLP